jgi:hypothetical protein
MTRFLVLLILLLVQVQLYAAATLGCRHGSEPAAQASVAVCPMHRASAADPPADQPDRPFDCQKCALHCGVAAQSLPAPAAVLPQDLAPERPMLISERHFYRFSPESPLRPPIAIAL